MNSITTVTVYCSSSREIAGAYCDAAGALGTAIAREGWTLVYGGNSIGCMKLLSDAARAAGGKVVGVTPQLLVDKGIADTTAYELIVTATMRERKAIMETRGDAFVTLPGGLGTLEEIFEIIVARMLGYHNKAIVLLNVNDYFNPLLTMIDHGIEQKFIKPQARRQFYIAQSVSNAIEYLRAYRTEDTVAQEFTSEVPSALK